MDISYLLLLQNLREVTGGFLNSFLTFVSNIAVNYYIAVPAFVIYWCVDKKKGMRILASWGTALCFNTALKNIFCVYRPWIRDERVIPMGDAIKTSGSYSFPSGHSTSASGFYSGVFLAFRNYKKIGIFAVSMVILTMFSRNYLGVHTPQDVLVGGSVGILSAIIVELIAKAVEKNPGIDWIILLGSTVIVMILLAYILLKTYPLDYVDGTLLVDPAKMTVESFKEPGRFYGIILGWFLERRFVRFHTDGTNEQKVIRALAGSLLYIFVWTAVCAPLCKIIPYSTVHFAIQAAAQVLFMTLYPMFWGNRIY